jgi:hypothetical protein
MSFGSPERAHPALKLAYHRALAMLLALVYGLGPLGLEVVHSRAAAVAQDRACDCSHLELVSKAKAHDRECAACALIKAPKSLDDAVSASLPSFEPGGQARGSSPWLLVSESVPSNPSRAPPAFPA